MYCVIRIICIFDAFIKRFKSFNHILTYMIRSLLISILIAISFFLPCAAQQESESVSIRYRYGYRFVEPDYLENRKALARIDELVRKAKADGNLDKVLIRSCASPDGTDKANLKLTLYRVDSLYSYLVNRLDVPEEKIEAVSCGVAWDSLREMVADSDMDYRDEVLDVMDNTSVSLNKWKGQVVSERKRRLMNLRGGIPYAYMKQEFFPELRQSIVVVICLKSVDPVEKVSGPESCALPLEETSIDYAQHMERLKAAANLQDRHRSGKQAAEEMEDSHYRWAVKTNVAYLAATVANLGVEYAFGKHFSVDVPVNYSPYTVSRNYRMRFLTVQPEFRYWLKNPLKGHFFGAHLNIGAFNISVDERNRYQTPDGFYGVGLSYGYMLQFARHWAVEFTVGAGYIHTRYDAYYNIDNGARFEKAVPYNYWGLTKVGIGLVYRFGK